MTAISVSSKPLTFGVVGYSTRSLVQAVTELGHRAVAIDAFGDQDTVDLALAVTIVDDWPNGILRAARAMSVDSWLLGGGMESLVDLLPGRRGSQGSLADIAPVYGTSSTCMDQLRSPEFCASLCGAGVQWPETSFVKPQSDLKEWLIKPFRSAGGLRVVAAQALAADERIEDANFYWQRRIDGRVLGVTWVLNASTYRDSASAVLGVTEAFGSDQWPAPSEFAYRGSIGPIAVSRSQRQALEGLGQRVLSACPSYRGLLQADLIEDRLGQLWLLEFNPRWTAGMELLHEAAHRPENSPLAEHLRAWGISPVPAIAWNKPAPKVVSKAIYYSPKEIELPQTVRRNLQSLRNWQRSTQASMEWCLADLPAVASTAPMRFLAGAPILTVKCRSV